MVKKAKITITLSNEVYEELEKMREISLGKNGFTKDRSAIYEKALIEGIKNIRIQEEIIKQLSNLHLDLDKLDVSKLNIETILKGNKQKA